MDNSDWPGSSDSLGRMHACSVSRDLSRPPASIPGGFPDEPCPAYNDAKTGRSCGAVLAVGLVRAELMQEILPRLPAMLAGTDRPTTLAQTAALADLCAQPCQSPFAVAVRFYDRAFRDGPALADDLLAERRYEAACCAARAARGEGADAPASQAEKAIVLAKALTWLRADRALWNKRATSSSESERAAAGRSPACWLEDPDLAGTRPGPTQIKLTAAEWDMLWVEVRDLRNLSTSPADSPQPNR